MTFLSDLEAGRADLQAHAESLMVESVLIERPGPSVLDPDTLEEVPSWTTVYEGPCKVRSSPVQSRNAAAGEVSYDVTSSYIDVPISVPSGLVRAGDRATITTARDSANAGRVFTVQRDVPRTFAVERRFWCEEVS